MLPMKSSSWISALAAAGLVAASHADEKVNAEPEARDQSAAEKKIDALGSLKDDLGIWLSLDSPEHGGVAWLRFPIVVTATKELEIREKAGRKYVDFRLPGGVLEFKPSFKLGNLYTLCTWMLFPAPKNHALVWQDDDPKTAGSALYVTGKALFAWSATAQAPRRYGVLPVGIQGWHHLAITADGKETRAFLDGKLIGSIGEIVATDLRSIGNHWEKQHQSWMMCAGLDDQLIFRRPLTAEEIQKVMQFEKPAAAK
jgi:hypothetical protein